MTDEQIDSEISDIMRWPTDADFIFMKNVKDAPEFVSTGYILLKAHRENEPIFLRHVQWNSLLGFESLRDMIQKGWIVD